MNARSIPASVFAPSLLLLLPACVIVLDGDGHWRHHGHDHGDAIRGSGVSATEARTVSDFRCVVVQGSADVTARIGGTTSLTVTGDDNLVAFVTTEVREGTLVIGMKPGSYSSRMDLRVDVTTPALESVSIQGSSDVDLSGLTGESFALEIRGSGDARARGKVDRLEADLAGSGDMHLFELEAREARVAIAGSGDVEAWATESLSASVAGSGDVRYKGEPKVTKSVAGSGSVAAAGLEAP